MTDTQATREKLVTDFKAVITDSEELLKSMAAAGGEKAATLRGDLERKLHTARERLGEIERNAVERAKAVAKDADVYVHEHPWRSVAIVAGIAGVLGILLGLLLNRR